LRDRLIGREVFPTIPPTVEYRLTPLGQSLLEPMQRLQQWAAASKQAMQTARADYDLTHFGLN
jgi:DNA-binding HxlR family transcriptional regulator